MIDTAYALGSGAGPSASQNFSAFIPLILMFVIFYFLLIRPQQKRSRDHREFLKSLKKGDWIVTSGGLHGKITGLTDSIATIEIADKVRIKVSRSHVAGLSKDLDKEQT